LLRNGAEAIGSALVEADPGLAFNLIPCSQGNSMNKSGMNKSVLIAAALTLALTACGDNKAAADAKAAADKAAAAAKEAADKAATAAKEAGTAAMQSGAAAVDATKAAGTAAMDATKAAGTAAMDSAKDSAAKDASMKAATPAPADTTKK
jgi:hypothetical protein